MPDKELTPERVKEIIAKAMSLELDKTILPEAVHFEVSAKMKVIDMFDNKAYVGTFEGIRIDRRKQI